MADKVGEEEVEGNICLVSQEGDKFEVSREIAMMSNLVKEMLGELVKKEDATKPLSDEDLVKAFTDKGLKIARRTVAKYRAELNILPSHLRRVY